MATDEIGGAHPGRAGRPADATTGWPDRGKRGVDPLPAGPDGLVCSAKGCRRSATHDLRWNNPTIHSADRRKHWLACPEHRDSLAAFLSARGFLREIEDLTV